MELSLPIKLKCGVQYYDWGSRRHGDNLPYIAHLLDHDPDENTPYAELWIGAHPKLPSRLEIDKGEEPTLNEAVSQYPEELLGPTVTGAGYRELPFLLKTLSCEKPLSIQAHPDRELARRLHQQDPENYPDPNHKPEIAIALTAFTAMCNFRPVEDVQKDLSRFLSLKTFFTKAINAYNEAEDNREWLKQAYARIFEAGEDEITGVLGVLNNEINKSENACPQDRLFQQLLKWYPGDRGALSAYFLNLIELQPGQAFAMLPDEPHCYVEGTIVECMANSDNVVRAGLTGKHVDTETLLSMFSYQSSCPQIMEGEYLDEGERRYRTGSEEFRVDMWHHDFGFKKTYQAEGRLSLLLVVSGQAEFRADDTRLLAWKGSTILWPGSLEELEVFFIDDNTVIYRASPDLAVERVEKPAEKEEEATEAETTETATEEGAESAVAVEGESAESPVETEETTEATAEESSPQPAVEEPGAGEAEAAMQRPRQSIVEEDVGAGQDFGQFLEQVPSGISGTPEPGQKISGTVTSVDAYSVFVDMNAKSEGVLDRSQLENDNGELTVQPGDRIEAFCVDVADDQVKLTVKMGAGNDTEGLEHAYRSGIPVEGRVESERKGGFDVSIGKTRAFCPYSQIDITRSEADQHIGQTYSFLITEYSERGRNVVLSRRRLLEQERKEGLEQLKADLYENAVVTARVTRIMPFGVFADIGYGIEGLIPNRELSWERGKDANELVSENDRVQVMIQSLDWQNERITLSLKAAQGDPWAEADQRYVPGDKYTGKVVSLAPYGAFVQLEPGVDGLLHLSKMGDERANHPKEIVEEGQEITVRVENIDLEQRRLSLAMEQGYGRGTSEEESVVLIEPGAIVTGTVENVREFGVFVRLPDGRTGLLHISQTAQKSAANAQRALADAYPRDSAVQVKVQQIKGDRISLALPQDTAESGESETTTYSSSEGEGLGTLGDILGNLDVEEGSSGKKQ